MQGRIVKVNTRLRGVVVDRRSVKKPLSFIQILLISASSLTSLTVAVRQVISVPSQSVAVPLAVVQPAPIVLSPDIVFVAEAEFERMSLLVGTTVFYQGTEYFLLGLTSDPANVCLAMLRGHDGKVNCADITTSPAPGSESAQSPDVINPDR